MIRFARRPQSTDEIEEKENEEPGRGKESEPVKEPPSGPTAQFAWSIFFLLELFDNFCPMVRFKAKKGCTGEESDQEEKDIYRSSCRSLNPC